MAKCPLQNHQIVGMAVFTGVLPVEDVGDVRILPTMADQTTVALPVEGDTVCLWEYDGPPPWDNEPSEREGIELTACVQSDKGTLEMGYGWRAKVLIVRWKERN